MGISIIGGAVTSFASAVPLLFAQLTVFNKFGIFIISIVSFSVLFSLFLFGSLAHLAGPTGKTGSLAKILCCHLCKISTEAKTYPIFVKKKESKRQLNQVTNTQPVPELRRKNDSSHQLTAIPENEF